MPPVPSKPSKPSKGICSRILRPMLRTKHICWFLAIIVAMFYSQRSRRVIMDASKTWNTQDKVIELFRDLLYDRYLTVGSDPHKSEEYETFNEDTFIEILKELHAMDKIKFPYNPIYNKPYYADSYLCKLYTLLGVDYKRFEIVPLGGRDSFYYSTLNIDAPRIAVYEDDGLAPSILIIANQYHPDYIPLENNEIKDAKVKKELSYFIEEETYNGFKYSLDSVILMNTNIKSCNHIIVGLTCKNKKYVYNGQPYMGTENYPCQLIKHNWNIQEDISFYLSANDCELHDTPQPNSSDRSYNFSEGNVIYIYVRKDASRNTSISLEADVKRYFETRAISRERKEAAILEAEIKEARLRYEEEHKKIMKDEEERQRKREESWDKEEEKRHIEEQMALIEIDDLAAIMANLKLDDKGIRKLISLPKADTKRKRKNSNSGSTPKPIITLKKQDIRVSPKKADTKRKREVKKSI